MFQCGGLAYVVHLIGSSSRRIFVLAEMTGYVTFCTRHLSKLTSLNTRFTLSGRAFRYHLAVKERAEVTQLIYARVSNFSLLR